MFEEMNKKLKIQKNSIIDLKEDQSSDALETILQTTFNELKDHFLKFYETELQIDKECIILQGPECENASVEIKDILRKLIKEDFPIEWTDKLSFISSLNLK